MKRPPPLALTLSALFGLPLLWFACTAPTAVPEEKIAAARPTPTPTPTTVATPAPISPALGVGFRSTVHPFVQTYCVECHGGEKPKAELNLSSYATLDSVRKDVRRWDQVLERVEAGEMPPDDADKQPTTAQRKDVITWLQAMRASEIQRTAGDPGIVLARRLSNAEYDYTIRDLTGADIHPTKEFPVDPANEAGFDNSGESLSMSPALVKKYLDAARAVADHLAFTPEGFIFAPYPVTTDEDRDKYAVNRIVDFYKRQGTSIGTRYDTIMAQTLDYADFFAAAWRFQNRAALGRANATLAEFAREAKVSPRYLATLCETLTTSGGDLGPIAALQSRWRKLPAPADGHEPASVRTDCIALRDFIMQVRPLVRMEFQNLMPNGRIIATGSQTMVLWKDRQFAENRTVYAGNALQADFATFAETDPALVVPTTKDAQKKYEEAFRRFCAVFPDAFYVAERARMFLTNQRDINSDLQGHRLLTAGFHSQMGYFRDDKPLYDLALDDAQRRELDTLWRELDFIAQVPFRQFTQFLWFERGEPPSVMVDPVFSPFRPEDADIISEAKLKRLGDVYYTWAEKKVLPVRPTRTEIDRAKNVGQTLEETGSTDEKLKLSATALQAVRDYFVGMNVRIRELEKAQKAAEPLHLKALVDFAERAYRRPLTAAERDDTLAFYRKLRKQSLSHEDAIRDSVVSVLMSPAFSYRYALPKREPANVAAIAQPLSDYELANRMSYFLWSSMPDKELLAHAAAGDLHRPDVLVAQTRRMLQDRKVSGLATEFGGNWLDIRRFEEHNAVDRERFPAFTNELREAMFEEPVRFFTDLAEHHGSVLDFVYGHYTFVNPVLAKHYGMPVPEKAPADKWWRVDDAAKYQRGGLLPMAAFLTKNAPGLRTSPVKRGHWVVTKLLGERIPAPPPNVPVLPTDETKLGDLTLRQTLAKHREDKSCASCHNKFDSFGLVFEGFGPVGEVRTTDLAGRPAETSAVFPDGSEGAGLAGLQTYFHAKVEHEFLDNLCRKLLVYALGRTLLPSDDLVVTALRQKLAANGHRFDTMIEEIVTSRQFLTKRTSPGAENIVSLP